MQRFLGAIFVASMALKLGCSPQGEVQSPTRPESESATPSVSETVSETPEDMAARVMEAVSSKDKERFMAAVTKKARESIASTDDGGFNGQDFESFEVGDAVVEGAEASVPVTAVEDGEAQKLNLKMRQEDGAWRLYALGIEVAPDTEMTVNFENVGEMLEKFAQGMGEALGGVLTSTMEAMFQSGSPEEIALKLAMFDALEPVSREDYESSWKLSENLRGMTRADALSAIAESIDLSIHLGEHEAALSEPVGFDTSGMARLEALERIANEAGLRTVLPDLRDWGIAAGLMEGMVDALGAVIGGVTSLVTLEGDGAEALLEEARQVESPAQNAITFTTDGPSTPPLFLGPFRLDLAELEENVPHATGNLVLRLTAYGLPAGVLSALETHDDGFQIQEVVNPDGSPLIEMDVRYMGSGKAVGSAYHDTASRELRGLLRSVDRIARITGMVELPRPTSVEEFDFAALNAGASQTIGGITVTVERVSAFASFSITGPEDVVEGLKVHAQSYGADGEPVIAHSSNYQSWQAGKGTLSLNTDETPSRVRLKIVLASEMSLYPFAFNAVPLANAAEQPEQLAALDFGAHDAPLKMTFVAFTKRESQFGEAKITIENVSNKLPVNAFVDFVYLDGNGVELASYPHAINGSFTADGWEPLAKPGEKVDTEQTAFQMPENTESIAFRFNNIEFMDGTKWEPEV